MRNTSQYQRIIDDTSEKCKSFLKVKRLLNEFLLQSLYAIKYHIHRIAFINEEFVYVGFSLPEYS